MQIVTVTGKILIYPIQNNNNVTPEPINKLIERGKWNSGLANLILDGIATVSHGRIKLIHGDACLMHSHATAFPLLPLCDKNTRLFFFSYCGNKG
jgi:hypothetical protein